MRKTVVIMICLFGVCSYAMDNQADISSPYAGWKNGPSPAKDFFPIGVWLQSPDNAAKYKEIGINTYYGLWKGPTSEQLAQLKDADMKLICRQNKQALEHIDDDTIIGWMQIDEPDNAGKEREIIGDPVPIKPDYIIEQYNKIKDKDASRPVFLNLGQGVANDNWHGRGWRTNHLEDYLQYIKGCDIVSFDIYPSSSLDRDVCDDLSYVAKGVDRLVSWSGGEKIVWNIIECSKVNSPNSRITPEKVRSQAWMSIVHGSIGIVYFVHQWSPGLSEASIFKYENKDTLDMVAQINQQITELAPVLNEPTVTAENDWLVVKSKSDALKLKVMHKRFQGSSYIFAVEMTGNQGRAEFNLANLNNDYLGYVLGERRKIDVVKGRFQDWFQPWDVHIYKITTPTFDRRYPAAESGIGSLKIQRK